jgi:hypothetical protein
MDDNRQRSQRLQLPNDPQEMSNETSRALCGTINATLFRLEATVKRFWLGKMSSRFHKQEHGN